MNKICTTIEQSKKLMELGIDINTADMFYLRADIALGEIECYPNVLHREDVGDDIPAWSLSALVDIIKDKCGYFELVYLNSTIDGRANMLKNVYRLSTDIYDIYEKEAIDACYEMILKLHELKLQ